MDTIFRKLSARRLLYMLCFGLLCLIDQRSKTCLSAGGWLNTFINLTGVVMAVLIMSHYRWRDFMRHRLVYLIWTVIAVIGGTAAVIWGRTHQPYWNAWIVAVLNVVLFGYIIIHIFLDIVVDKYRPELNKWFVLSGCIMMAWMILSASEYRWPLYYFIMFACFVLTPFTQEEQRDLLQGLLDGIILSFFAAVVFCCVFRPYDRIRYSGVYSNPNVNAMSYLEVLAAVLAKLVMVFKKNSKWWWKAYYFLSIGAVLSFIVFTIGRVAWITAFFLVLAGLWALWHVRGHKKFILSGFTVLLCICLTFPVCYSLIRYIPPLFHHPVWFEGEWNEDKVHSWDPWDSEKYVEPDEFAETAFGRLASVLKDFRRHVRGEDIAIDGVESTDPTVTDESVFTDERVDTSSPEYEAAIYKDPDVINDSLLTRGTIYRYYFTRLNLFGQPYSEQGFQLTPTFWILHAHNIFLQFGTDFGIPVMILLAVLGIWAVVLLRRKVLQGREAECIAYILFIMVPLIYGLLEYSWGVGSLSIFLLFLSWSQVMKCDPAKETPDKSYTQEESHERIMGAN